VTGRPTPEDLAAPHHLARAVAAALALAVVACAGAGAPREVCRNRTGTHDGFFYTFWKDFGRACMTLGPGGSYHADYALGGGNLVAGVGWRPGSATRRVGYNAAAFEPGTNSYLTLYGWSTDPLVEYYVVESWGSGFTPPGDGAPVLGTVQSDGGTYSIYRTTRVEKPSIRGTRTFDQFWSVRTARRPVGSNQTITFANHVAAWRELGMELGTMDYQVMATEGYGSTGRSGVRVWEE
jgi:endo-1,4-beta-xylanase